MKKLTLMLTLLTAFATVGTGTHVAHAQSVDPISATAPNSADFVIFSFVQIKDNVAVDYKKAIFEYAALTRKEAGNLEYVIHQSAEDYRKFAIYEHWASAEARTQHLAAPYTVQFFAQMKNVFLQGDPVRFNYQVLESK